MAESMTNDVKRGTRKAVCEPPRPTTIGASSTVVLQQHFRGRPYVYQNSAAAVVLPASDALGCPVHASKPGAGPESWSRSPRRRLLHVAHVLCSGCIERRVAASTGTSLIPRPSQPAATPILFRILHSLGRPGVRSGNLSRRLGRPTAGNGSRIL